MKGENKAKVASKNETIEVAATGVVCAATARDGR